MDQIEMTPGQYKRIWRLTLPEDAPEPAIFAMSKTDLLQDMCAFILQENQGILEDTPTSRETQLAQEVERAIRAGEYEEAIRKWYGSCVIDQVPLCLVPAKINFTTPK